jgi:hypothetical protein
VLLSPEHHVKGLILQLRVCDQTLKMDANESGALNWRLSAHPITLLCYLGFRIGIAHDQHFSLCIPANTLSTNRQPAHVPLRRPFHQKLVRLHNTHHPCRGVNFHYSVLVFILTLILLAIDFYYLKNIAGRRLVGLRWWNEVNTSTGESHWVFESSSPETRTINATDKRFFWLTMYLVPALWVGLAILAILRLIGVIWLVIVGMLRRFLQRICDIG